MIGRRSVAAPPGIDVSSSEDHGLLKVVPDGANGGIGVLTIICLHKAGVIAECALGRLPVGSAFGIPGADQACDQLWRARSAVGLKQRSAVDKRDQVLVERDVAFDVGTQIEWPVCLRSGTGPEHATAELCEALAGDDPNCCVHGPELDRAARAQRLLEHL